MSLKGKTLLISLIALAILILFLSITLMSTIRQRQIGTDYVSRVMPLNHSAHELFIEMHHYSRLIEERVEEHVTAEEFESKKTTILEKINNHLTLMKQKAAKNDLATIVDTHRYIDRVIAQGDEVIKYHLSGKTEKSRELLERFHTTSEEICHTNASFNLHLDRDADTFYQAHVDAGQKSIFLLFTTGAVILLIALLLIYLFTRQVILPITSLSKALKKSHELPDFGKILKRSDELGSLARVIDSKSRDLKKEEMARIAREKELRNLVTKLNEASRLATLGELAAVVGHEIKSPLTVAGMHTEIIEKELEENVPQIAEMARSLHAQKKALSKIDYILTGLQKHARETGEEESTFDVMETSKDIVEFISPLMKKDGIKVICQGECKSAKLTGNPDRFAQVLVNLIMNARDALSKSSNPVVEITFKENEKSCGFDIKDNGSGISDSMKERIFDGFFTTKHMNKGTGLGLSISKKIVEEMNGTISVESEKGKGSTFKVTFQKNAS